MKHITKRILAIVLMATLLVTCMASPAFAASKKTKTVKTTKLTLSQTKTVKLNVGDSTTLTATVKPKNSTQAVKWSTSNKKVVTVKDGKLTAKKEGSATITAKSGSKSKTVKVKVTDPTKPTGISLDYTKTVKLPKNQKLKITATLKPATAKGTVKWSSSNKSIMTICVMSLTMKVMLYLSTLKALLSKHTPPISLNMRLTTSIAMMIQ